MDCAGIYAGGSDETAADLFLSATVLLWGARAGNEHMGRNCERRTTRRPVVWPVGMYGSPISMREDQVTEHDRETFFAALQELSGDTVVTHEVEEILDKLVGPRACVFCERWAKELMEHESPCAKMRSPEMTRIS